MRLIDAGMRDAKYTRADLFWNKIAESAFFSAAEKGKIRAAIEKEPGEDVQPVVPAHWIERRANNGNMHYVCSHCGKEVSYPYAKKRCKDCKHWTQSTGKMKGYGLGRCDFHDADLVTCNGFCYWAEGRTDG